MFLGIDGCPGGWYAVSTSEVGGPIRGEVYPRFSDLLGDAPPFAIIAVDIPIGLQAAGSRACDTLARAMLSPTRSASVFPAPLRPVLSASTHQEASALRRSIESKGMSIQSFAITAKVREVDDAVRIVGSYDDRVYEVHPEVSFTFANGGVPLTYPKKKAAGRAERLRLLSDAFGNAPARLLSERKAGMVGADDVLDALVALWSAYRIGRGEHSSLPALPGRDSLGNRMAIFY